MLSVGSGSAEPHCIKRADDRLSLIVINNPAHLPWRTAGLIRMSGPAITHRTTAATSNELASSGNTVA